MASEKQDMIQATAADAGAAGDHPSSEFVSRMMSGLVNDTQFLVARIKRSSKYWGQTEPNAWFDVRVVNDNYYQLRGNNNNYRLIDVVCGIRFADGTVVDLKTGKKSS